MSKEVEIPIKAWSYSRYKAYCLCPYKFKRQVVDKAPFIENEAIKRGNRIHKAAEDYITCKRNDVAPELQGFTDQLAWLREMAAAVEQQWAFTDEWEATGWFDRDAWCRIKMDAYVIEHTGLMTIADHKTGREYRDDHLEQLELYVVGGFAMFADVDEISAEMWYVDSGNVLGDDRRWHREKDYKRLIKVWDRRTKAMLSDTKFTPKPSHLCRNCEFGRSNGDGTCRF